MFDGELMCALLILFVSFLLPAAQAATPRARETGTAVIRGRVTLGDTAAPLRRAIVRLITVQGNIVDTRTDTEGLYAFTAVPAGRYLVRAEPPDFVATHLGQAYSESATAGSSRIDLKNGEVRANVNIALPRAFAVSGRVVDDVGEPVARVAVEVQSRDDDNGVRGFSGRRTSDDQGAFRLFGLAPGRYIVCAKPPTSMQRQAGPSRQRERLTATCYPSALAEMDAAPVTIKGSDVGGVEIRLLRSGSYTVSGIVVNSSGTPVERPTVTITTFERNGSGTTPTTSDTDGRFSIPNLTPGRYAVGAEIGGPDRPEQRRDLELGSVPITIEATDVKDLVVTMTKAVSVAGRVVFEDGVPPARGNGPPLFVRAVLDGETSGEMLGRPGVLLGDLTFQLDRLFGRRTIVVENLTPGWMLSSVRYKGKDITDVSTELHAGTDPSDLEIVLSNRGAIVSGTVAGDSGKPVRARVFMVPIGRVRWKGLQTAVSAVSSPAGRFQLAPQRSGDYVIVAVNATDPVPDVQDARFFERILARGRGITLTENDRRTIDLTLTQLPETR